MVRCREGTLYTGIATNVARRFSEHQNNGNKAAKYLRGRGPLELVLEKALGTNKRVALSLELVRNRETVVKDLAAEAPAAPTGSFRVFPDTQARAGQLERAIALMEQRLETLRKQLAELKAADKPATPDR